jgi:hypothetical protein
MNILLLLLLPFVLANTDLTQFENDEGFPCKNEVPAMTVGDEFVGYKHNLQSIKKEIEGSSPDGTFILGVSEYDCDECCKGEVLLTQVKRLFDTGDIAFEGKSIPIVRIDIGKHGDQLQSEELYLDGIPRIYLYHQGRYFIYIEGDNLNLFLNFMNRVLYPLAKLETDSQVELFSNAESEYIESSPLYVKKYRAIGDLFNNVTKITRVLAIVPDSEKYQAKIDELEGAARNLSERTDLRIGIVTEKAL